MGPLQGVRVIEIAGIGPGPFCAMMLSDMGADVVRIDRKSFAGRGTKYDVLNRGRRSIALDLKNSAAVEALLTMVEQADVLQEGFRPGVMERLGLGPEICQQRNPRLVYGRMTGWGQEGPLANAAGHDINYISLTGVLHSIGRPGQSPVPPLNLVGDFGGGGMLLAFGITCALLEARQSGKGQVVDAAMTDGSAALMAGIYGLKNMGVWSNDKGHNMLDSGSHFYDTYECADGRWISLGSIEPQFYALLREKAELDESLFDEQMKRESWPQKKVRLAAVIKKKTRDQWCEIMEGSDVCFAPVLNLDEAPEHPHNQARQTFVNLDGVKQPNAAPRFNRTPGAIQGPPPTAGQHSEEALADWGLSIDDIGKLKETGAI